MQYRLKVLRRIFLCYELEILRVFAYFLHHRLDFFFGGNINYPNRCKIDVHLHMAVTVKFVVIVDFNTLNQRIDNGRRKFPNVRHLPKGTEYQP